jgi:cytochrome c oxidase subunit I
MVVTVGAFIIALSVLVFMWNWRKSRRRGLLAGMDPWDARTIEWMTPNPTPEHNFTEPPTVTKLDHFWHLKYDEDAEGRPMRRAEANDLLERLDEEGRNPRQAIHLPNPSYFPIIAALGIPLAFYGIIYHTSVAGKALIVVGALVTLSALIGWGMEPLEEHHDEHEDEEVEEIDEEGGSD